jgi:transposase
MDKRIIQKAGKYFTEEEKHKIIRELISTRCTKVAIWEKYTGEEEEHGQMLLWMRQLGYSTGIKTRKPDIVPNLYPMAQRKTKLGDPIGAGDGSFESLQLKKRIAELEKQLKDAELKAIAFSTMVDMAEREFKIPIRKKLNTKP